MDICILGREQDKPKKLCSRYLGRKWELPKSFPAILGGKGNYQKVIPLFGTGKGITKKLSRYLGRKRESQKSIPAVWEREFKAFLLGNIRERKIPLMPALY